MNVANIPSMFRSLYVETLAPAQLGSIRIDPEQMLAAEPGSILFLHV